MTRQVFAKTTILPQTSRELPLFHTRGPSCPCIPVPRCICSWRKPSVKVTGHVRLCHVRGREDCVIIFSVRDTTTSPNPTQLTVKHNPNTTFHNVLELLRFSQHKWQAHEPASFGFKGSITTRRSLCDHCTGSMAKSAACSAEIMRKGLTTMLIHGTDGCL